MTALSIFSGVIAAFLPFGGLAIFLYDNEGKKGGAILACFCLSFVFALLTDLVRRI